MSPIVRFALAVLVFAACSLLSKLLPAYHQVSLKAMLIVASVVLILLSRKPFREYGFTWPRGVKWSRVLLIGLLLGILSSVGALLMGLTGMRILMKDYSFAQVVLVVWFWSSLSEEIFCRGWFQSGLPMTSSRPIWSAALFGSMHLSLLFAGLDVGSVLWVVLFTTSVGWFCAKFRDQYDSWIPAFATHALANVGGLVGGVIYSIIYRLVTGQLPAMP